MSTNAIKARGTVISIDATGHKTIGEVASFTGPQQLREVLETTDLSETHDSHVAGIMRSGDLAMSLHCYPADTGQTALEAAYAAGSTDEYKITFSDGTIYTGDGIVTSKTPTGSVGTVVTMDVTIKVTTIWVKS